MTGDEASGRHDDTARDGPSLGERLATATERFTARWATPSRRVEEWARHSRIGAVSRRCQGAIGHSWLLRWVTREPDPEIVVVDLTETRTVGPLLRLLDRFVALVQPAGQHSAVGRAILTTIFAVSRNVVPVLSACLLGVVAGTVLLTGAGAEPLWLVALAIAGVAGLLGLGVDRSRAAVEDSTVVEWTSMLLAPPEDPTG